MSDVEQELRDFFAAETADVDPSPALPHRVRVRVQERRRRKRIAASACGLLAIGVVLAYAMPKITADGADQAGLLPSQSTAAPTTLAPPAVMIPEQLPQIPASGPTTGEVLAVRRGRIVVLDAASGAVVRTVSVKTVVKGDRVVDATYSPDRTVIYLSFRAGCEGDTSSYGIQQVPAAGGEAAPVTSGNDFGFSVSPDGTRLAFARLASGCGAHTVVVRDLRTGTESLRELTAGVVARVGWAGNDRLVVGATVGNGRQRVLITPATGTESLDLAPALVSGVLLDATTAPDGRHVLVQSDGRVVDVDPDTDRARGSLGVAAGGTAAGFAAEPGATRFAASWILAGGTDGAPSVWADGHAETALPEGTRPVDWAG